MVSYPQLVSQTLHDFDAELNVDSSTNTKEKMGLNVWRILDAKSPDTDTISIVSPSDVQCIVNDRNKQRTEKLRRGSRPPGWSKLGLFKA